jgi:hypothetical protein
MSKKLILAIKDLPEEYIDDKTQFAEHKELVIAVNPLLEPITWKDGSGWSVVEYISIDINEPIYRFPDIVEHKPGSKLPV